MSMSDVMLPIIVVVIAIMGFVGGCDRARIWLLEDDSREYRKRIQQLELSVSDLSLRLSKTNSGLVDSRLKLIDMKGGAE